MARWSLTPRPVNCHLLSNVIHGMSEALPRICVWVEVTVPIPIMVDMHHNKTHETDKFTSKS